jgi:RNA-directed DNA polymerase
VEYLAETFSLMNRHGAPGVDRVSMAEYGLNLNANLVDLVGRMKRRAYDAPPVRRVYIPKAGSDKLRPLGIPAVEDRLLQAAVARLLSAIYEPIFRDSSFGFRPGRSAHDALRRVREVVMGGRVQYVYETDVRSFFDRVEHDWLMRMLELKVGDPWILRLVRKWLKAGILENGAVTHPEKGTPQGGPLSPVLANVYLHYALDLWFDKVVRSGLRGKAELVRYADDLVVLFESETDAERFAQMLPERLAKFGLEGAPEKTRLIPFGARFWRQGKGATGTFEFLGFSHHVRTNRKGRMVVLRVPTTKSVRRFLMEMKRWLRANMHLPPAEQQKALVARLLGFYRYFALWGCTARLSTVRRQVLVYWQWVLSRRSQRGYAAWAWLNRRKWFALPEPRLLHPTV